MLPKSHNCASFNSNLDQFLASCSVVVFEAKVGDEVGAHDVAQCVLELHGLDKQIMLGIEAFASLR